MRSGILVGERLLTDGVTGGNERLGLAGSTTEQLELTGKTSDLIFDGVEIKSVDISNLVIYCDKFHSDITNVVDIEVLDKKFSIDHFEGEDFIIKTDPCRLNHLPFTFNLYVRSDHAVKSVVRVFFGSKYNRFGRINKNREKFVLLDLFECDLAVGDNVITRDSKDFTWYVKDTDYSKGRFGLPDRMMLPKGGMEFQFFFIVTQYTKPTDVDELSFGYRLDRGIDETYWYAPNMFINYDVKIFH